MTVLYFYFINTNCTLYHRKLLYVCYKYQINQDRKIPVKKRALTGYLSELRLTTKEFKGKDSIKLDTAIAKSSVYSRQSKTVFFSSSILLFRRDEALANSGNR